MSTSDPRSLSLPDLRALRTELQQLDDAISYVRRLAQARLDLARAEMKRRSGGSDAAELSDELPAILGAQLTGGQARPPRPADDFSDHPLAQQLEQLCADAGSAGLTELSGDELEAYVSSLSDFERVRSTERKELFARIDELSAELVRRYRDGEADVDRLLDDDEPSA